MQARSLFSSGSSFEAAWGYSRAVMVGDTCHVSGTTGFDYAAMTIVDDAEAQTRQAFANLAAALAQAGLGLEHLVRVRYLVPRRSDWEVVGRLAGELLGGIRPAATAMIVELVDPRMRIEIEADAVR